MYLPLNGRIAIVEDNILEAKPLMNEFARARVPFIFFQGDEIALIPEDSSQNDIRILFLDINLLSHATPTVKDIQASIYAVINRIISKDNFPYVLIYWSKQEDEYASTVQALFENELKEKAPIAIKSFVKSDYFTLEGKPIENGLDLKAELIKVLLEEPSYCALISWENITHQSSNKTLQEVFGSYSSDSNWQEKTDDLLYKLGVSYSSSHFDSQDSVNKLKSSFNTLNTIFNDTLETVFHSFQSDFEPQFNKSEEVDSPAISSLNKKLLFSEDILPLEHPGSVLEIIDEGSDTFDLKNLFGNIFNSLVSFSKAKYPDISCKELSKKRKELRDEIKKDAIKLAFVATPSCDFAHKKSPFHRLILGAFIKAEKKDLLVSGSEAFFCSPSFLFNGSEFILILDFKHFFTTKSLSSTIFKPILRARQQLLAEVQSKLSRHINRQGILFIE